MESHRIGFLCASGIGVPFTIIEGKIMRVEITVNGDDREPAIVMSSCVEPELVNVRLYDEIQSRDVKIEDLKLALRKLSAK